LQQHRELLPLLRREPAEVDAGRALDRLDDLLLAVAVLAEGAIMMTR
jgi:hypothetical protein